MSENQDFLELSEADKTAIGIIAKQNKFRIEGNDIIYAKNNRDLLSNFNKGIRYLINIKNNTNSSDIINKINVFLINNDNLINQAISLENSFESIFKFNINKKIEILVNANNRVINKTIDLVHSLGRSVKMYNVDDTSGYY